MKKFGIPGSFWVGVLLTVGGENVVHAQPGPDNRAPQVSISWPAPGDLFRAGTTIRIKAAATDPDGSVAQVQFFAQPELIGVVTNPPFNLLWQVESRGAASGSLDLQAVAVDDLGAQTESAIVTVTYYTGGPPRPVLEIISPVDGAVFPVPATFDFSAELLASSGGAGPVEFFVGTNSVGIVEQGGWFSATTPPNSITVTNLAEGEHKLTVRYRGLDGTLCSCVLKTNTVRVVKLGFQSPYLTPDGHPLPRQLRESLGRATTVGAMSFWTDAAILGGAGIASVVFGPGGAGLHGLEEYVRLDEVLACREALVTLARKYCA